MVDKINNVYKSESATSHLSCYSNDDEQRFTGERTKIFSNTKSRLLVRYNEESTYKDNVRQLKLDRNYESGSSETTLCVVKHRRMLEQHQPMKDELPSLKYDKQTKFNRTFAADRSRRHSDKEITSSITKKSTRKSFSHGPILWKTDDPQRGQANVLTNQYYTEICESSSIYEIASGSKEKQEFSVQDRSFTYRNSGGHRVDTSLKSKTIVKVDKWHNDDFLNQLLKGEHFPQNGSNALKQFRTESKLVTRNDQSNEYNDLNIDFQSIKESLGNSSSPIRKFELLQSLILTLSNQEPVERQATVQAIVDIDLFDLKCDCESSSILKDLLWPLNARTPHPLQTSAAKLLNSIVSHQIGRDYFNETSMVDLLTWSSSEVITDSMADNLMAVMKKLSLNKSQLYDMLEQGLVQWLISHMEQVEFSASSFHLECMTDLLRMLMNVENASEFTFVNVPHLIIVLVRYLNVENEYVQANVSHVLRVLLQNKTAVEIGNKINLHRIIQHHLEKASDSKLRADLQFISRLFVKSRSDNSHKLGSSTIDDRSHNSSSGNSVVDNSQFQHPDLKEYSDDPKERIICEKNLTNSSEILAVNNGNQDEFSTSISEPIENMQVAEKRHQSLPADLRSYLLQLCLDEESTDANSQMENSSNENGNTNPVAEILFSNLHSGLFQSSSLLSGGSQFSSTDECKKKAIKTLKMRSINKNVAAYMETANENVATNLTSELQSNKVNENTPRAPADYTDFSSIAKDPNARNEILENESFIDELCDKVLKKLRSKIADSFCGSNCNSNCTGNCN